MPRMYKSEDLKKFYFDYQTRVCHEGCQFRHTVHETMFLIKMGRSYPIDNNLVELSVRPSPQKENVRCTSAVMKVRCRLCTTASSVP